MGIAYGLGRAQRAQIFACCIFPAFWILHGDSPIPNDLHGDLLRVLGARSARNILGFCIFPTFWTLHGDLPIPKVLHGDLLMVHAARAIFWDFAFFQHFGFYTASVMLSLGGGGGGGGRITNISLHMINPQAL